MALAVALTKATRLRSQVQEGAYGSRYGEAARLRNVEVCVPLSAFHGTHVQQETVMLLSQRKEPVKLLLCPLEFHNADERTVHSLGKNT